MNAHQKRNAYARKWYAKNKKRINARLRARYKTDPKYIAAEKANNKRHYERNKKRLNKAMSAYQREYYKKNVPYRLSVICKARINEALRFQGAKRFYPYETLIGCSWKELQQYLTKKFKKGMTWKYNNNKLHRTGYEFHIDHIKPVGTYDLNYGSQQLKAFNYKNTQPLFIRDHCIKTNKYQNDIEIELRKSKRNIREYNKALKRLAKN